MTAGANGTRVAAGALLRGEALAGPHLVVRDGPDAGRRYPLGTDQTLGRGRRADLRLSDPAASRLHLRLTRVGGRFALADLRSKNGVRVNGQLTSLPRTLEVGDELAIGATRLLLEPGILDPVERPPSSGASGAGEPPSAALAGATTADGHRALLLGAGALAALAALLLLP